MFIGNIDNIDKDGGDFHPIIYSVLEYLRATDFSNFNEGAYPLPHTDFIAKIQRYKTKPTEDCRPESHEKFIDVQFVAKGEEAMGWCPLSPELEIVTPYDSKADVTFYKKLLPESSVMLSSRTYAVLFPLDVHSPCGSVDEGEPSDVTKIVVKVPVELIIESDSWSLNE